jgi:5-oxoprolinase (ATP-hydrolysing)
MSIERSSSWRIWVDTGGTFTDCVALDGEGTFHREKVLSSSALRGVVERAITPRKLRVGVKWRAPEDFVRGFRFRLMDSAHPEVEVERYDPSASTIELSEPVPTEIRSGSAFEVRSPEEAPVLAARLVTRSSPGRPLPGITMRLATTRGTNALLERCGPPTALFITGGFRDLPRIGDQQRPDLFALDIQKPEPLYHVVVEVEERIAADGTVIVPLRLDTVSAEVARLLEDGIRHAAVALMHSYQNPSHEHELARHLLQSGFKHVSCSADLAPFIKILPRSETAVVNAYLASIIEDYLVDVQEPLSGGQLYVMTSTGGIVRPRSYHAKDSLLSGPVGGVVGGVSAGRRSGFTRIITFDMGGTSTDVARFDGDYEYTFEYEVGGAHLVAPALSIESVAAGGGSICGFDGTELRVGPESAGSEPGPACYGAGGPLTLTDVNLLLGRLDGSRFEIPIDTDSAGRRIERIAESIEKEKKQKIDRERLLEGFRDIANERMADAIRRISIRKGYDPRDYTLVAFGGAGGQHACAVAEQLGMDTILIPADAGLLSALGLGHSVIERFAERQILRRLDDVGAGIPVLLRELAGEAIASLEGEGIPRNEIEVRRRIANLRFIGQDSVLQVEFDEETPLGGAFESKYRDIFGHWQEDRQIEVESLRVVASSRKGEDFRLENDTVPSRSRESGRVRAHFDGRWESVPAFERYDIARGARLEGPALIFERYSVTAVENGWNAEVDGAGSIVLKRVRGGAGKDEQVHPEVVRLELFSNRFETIAREMGEMLRRTAISTNIKERLDFSCAILDGDGELVVNAPHIPVHLGAMGLCVRALRDAVQMEPGDVVATNHPVFGGSHLPDVTVVTPVYLPDRTLLGYVANRAHHAEIGGARPGSMPPAATTLSEEGVVIPPMYLLRHGNARWEELYALLAGAKFPSRAIEENVADVNAAVAANRSGEHALLRLAAEHGPDTIRHYMDALKVRAESKIRAALRKIPDGSYEALETLDDGSPLRVKIDIAGGRASIDFSGSAPVHPKNLNATPAVVRSVVMYVLRLLINEPLPLNEGLMRAITIHIPPGILNPPFPDDPSRAPAVVGGNVETSQRLVDTLLKALHLAACSQGTMNNVLFGTDRYSYYETVCGGAGAGPGFDGASAVHSHMTNTRITDPEIIEHRYPVTVERFEIRRGSGGEGRHRGGNGVVRVVSFREPMSLSVLGQHRCDGPYGLDGGEPGKPAGQYVVRASGETVSLSSIDGCEVYPGDRFVLETPGGGGYGMVERAEEV